MSPVQWRVISNVNVHGVHFAVTHEARRFMRRGGISYRVAHMMAAQLVKNILADTEIEHVTV
jgi:argininosuccinate lyase